MTKRTSNKKRERASFDGYLNYLPDEEDRREIKDNLLTADKVLSFLQGLADDGYRVSIKHDQYRGTQVLECYSQWKDMQNAGRTLVVAHDDVLVSASALKHFWTRIADGGVWPEQRTIDNPYSW